MNKKTYIQPLIQVVALEINPILAADSIQAYDDHETEDAFSKGNSFDDWDDADTSTLY
jgi:hypothetical protein